MQRHRQGFRCGGRCSRTRATPTCSDGVGASTPRRQTERTSDVVRHHKGVEGMHAACAPPQVPSPPRTRSAAPGESQAREVAPARAPNARVHGGKRNNEERNKIIRAQGVQHVGVPASGQYGDGIRRAPRFHNAKHVKLTENPARERAERHASVAGPDSASGGVHNADQHGGRSSGAFSVPVVAPMSARGSPGSMGIFALPKCAA